MKKEVVICGHVQPVTSASKKQVKHGDVLHVPCPPAADAILLALAFNSM